MEERTVRTATVDLPGGRELRALLWPADGDRGGTLVLATAWSDAAAWDTSERLHVPAAALPGLAEALGELAEGEE